MLTPELLQQARRVAWLHRRRKSVPLRLLGAGHFSVVYDLGSGYVLKVGGRSAFPYRKSTDANDSFRSDGQPTPDAWPAYAEWVMKQRRSWMPKVYHLEFIGEYVYFAVCERLYEQSGKNWSPLPIPTRIVASMANPRGFDEDLHDGNYMQRGNGTVVITDPWKPMRAY